MLVYEKKVDDERRLFGTMKYVPADDDVELTYKDADGAEITPIEKDSYVDNGHGGIIRKSDDKQVNVFIGETMIIPKDGEAPTPVDPQLTKIEWASAPTKVEYVEGEALELAGAEIKAIYTDGSEVNVTEDCTFAPAEGDELALGMDEVVASFEGKNASQAISVREYVNAEAVTDIGEKVFVAGAEEPVEYSVSTVAGDDAGKMVKGYFTADYRDKCTIEYYEVKDGNWYEFKGSEFGPKTGFPLTDTSSKFRAKFIEGSEGTYSFQVDIKTVEDGEVLCSVSASVTVVAQ